MLLGCSGAVLGYSCLLWGALGLQLHGFGVLLGCSWVVLSCSWPLLGCFGSPLGCSWGAFKVILAHLGVVLCPFGMPFGVLFGVVSDDDFDALLNHA